MVRGVGYGKIILFGEHFVVHGAPAIAAGISNACVVDIERAKANSITSTHKVSPELSVAAIENLLASMGIPHKYSVSLEGDLPTYGGLGSSAAFCVALVRALAEDNHHSIRDDDVNRHAYEGEKAFHGNPSGVDNVMATYGGVMEFVRGKSPVQNKFERIQLAKTLDVVVSLTGKYGPTTKMIEAVSKLKEEDPGDFAQLMDEYRELELEGRKALEKGRLEKIGNLMNENQRLLDELGVSDELNDTVNALALANGALGAKLTGGGGGGCCILLAADQGHAAELASKLSRAGFKSFCTQILKR